MLRLFVIFITLCISACATKHNDNKEKKEIQEIKSNYNTDVPESILTLSRYDTRLGSLEFKDGIPTKETSKKVYDNLDFLRGVETFLNGIPAASLHSIRKGMLDLGLVECNHVAIADDFLFSNPLLLTGNTSTVYANLFFDLKKDGPIVIEVPKGTGPGTVNDAFFRFVIDMGAPGPDKGKGGKYLILPPDFKGKAPEGYFVAQSTSYINWLILRGLPVNGKPDFASHLFRTKLKVYPLKDKDNPPNMKFLDISKKAFNTIHANNYHFYEELHEAIDYEPISFLDPELRGLFASVGIEKSKPFKPDNRMKKILEEAVAVGNATARAIVFDTREKGAVLFKGTHWEKGFIGGDYRWLKNKGLGGRYLDARTKFFYVATVNTPAMVWKLLEVGSQYGLISKDVNGEHFDGDKTYKLTLPANPPVKNFWSVVVYDPQTRSELQTSQLYPSVTSRNKKLKYNKDGSIDLYFGPTAPKGQEENWVQTIPGKSWFAILRLYGPLKEWYDDRWIPGEFIEVK